MSDNDVVNNWLLLTRNIVTLSPPIPALGNLVNKTLKYSTPRQRLRCKSGLVLSIQAGESNYCTPKNIEGPYTTVEIMVINYGNQQLPAAFTKLIGDDKVMGYVPIKLVNQVIKDNGGIDLIEGEG